MRVKNEGREKEREIGERSGGKERERGRTRVSFKKGKESGRREGWRRGCKDLIFGAVEVSARTRAYARAHIGTRFKSFFSLYV